MKHQAYLNESKSLLTQNIPHDIHRLYKQNVNSSILLLYQIFEEQPIPISFLIRNDVSMKMCIPYQH